MDIALNSKQEHVEKQKLDLYAQQDIVRTLFHNKDNEIKDLKETIES